MLEGAECRQTFLVTVGQTGVDCSSQICERLASVKDNTLISSTVKSYQWYTVGNNSNSQHWSFYTVSSASEKSFWSKIEVFLFCISIWIFEKLKRGDCGGREKKMWIISMCLAKEKRLKFSKLDDNTIKFPFYYNCCTYDARRSPSMTRSGVGVCVYNVKRYCVCS